MRIYILGIGGTLMGSIAQLAKALGHDVSGFDEAVYPPMSEQLAGAGIRYYEGFEPGQLEPEPNLVIVGNANLPRGNKALEAVLDRGLRYTSGAAWIGDALLHGRWVLGVAGTHGKTTTASMLAWILEAAGLEPGFLIGGVPANFRVSARLGGAPFFVIEADEYDTSYFDRRSKFVHYRPRTLVLNNLEYDHADIFDNLEAIQVQFHHLLRTIPGNGLVIAPGQSDALQEVLQRGCWTPISRFGDRAPRMALPTDNGELWSVGKVAAHGRSFEVSLSGSRVGEVDWDLIGRHNQHNALTAIAAARHAGVPVAQSIEALADFRGVARRMELLADTGRVRVYDDFAHHPTAIRATLEGLRQAVGNDEIIAVIEPRSHTMSLGTLRQDLTTCCAPADQVLWFRGSNIKWDLGEVVQNCVVPAKQYDDLELMKRDLIKLDAGPRQRHIVLMSNGAFGDLRQTLPALLEKSGRD
ncbi:MAG: UDP-N-acetylmuramate:L-alanyl-gamma-D-glutamyl-meso-diaminopimelate ligase [Pseudomonadota bacterium]